MLSLTAIAIAAGVFLRWQLRDALMMAFGAIVVAVLLVALADLMRRVLPLPHRGAVTLSAVLVLVAAAGFVWLTGAQVSSQFSNLWGRLPVGIEQIENRLGLPILGGGGQESAQAEGGADVKDGSGGGAPGSELLKEIASYGMPVANAIFGAVLVAIAGAFLALKPEVYRRGTVKLFPPPQHGRIDETLGDMGRALRFWLIGVLISMAIVGGLTGLGTWLIGLPAPIALGLFAALMEFVPVIGPIVGAVPAVLLALPEGGTMVLWTVLLYLGIQQLESNMIMPVVQERMVSVPPALFLLAFVVFGGIFGILGAGLAAPLAVVTVVAVQKLWVRETLHEETTVTGERGSDER